MFCQHCGENIDEGTKFCPFCGNKPEMLDEDQTSELSDYGKQDMELNEKTEAAEEVSASIGLSAAEDLELVPEADSSQLPDDTQQLLSESNSDNTVKGTTVKKQKRFVKKAGTGTTVAVCALFMVVTLVLTICTSSMWAAREILSDGMLSDMVTDSDPLSVKVGDIITDAYLLDSTLKQVGIEDGVSGISADDTLGEAIERSFSKYGLTEDNAEQFLENSALLPYISDLVGAYENYLLTGVDDKPVTEKNLKAVIIECVDYAKKEFGVKFAVDAEEQIDKVIKDNKDIIRSVNPTYALGAGGKYIRYIFFAPVLVAASIITIAAAALSGVITKRVDAALITLGVPTILFGVIFLFTGLFPRVIISWVNVPNTLFGDSIEEIGAVFTKIGLAEFVTGAIFIAGFVLCRVIVKRMADKAAKVNSSSVQNV